MYEPERDREKILVGKDETTRVNVPRELRWEDGGLNLATTLQYSPFTGFARTRAFIREFTERIYGPAYDDWTTLHTGNTDGCGRTASLFANQRWWVVGSTMLLNPRDTLLVEEWTYPSALALARPIDVRWKVIPIDGQGMHPYALRAILAG